MEPRRQVEIQLGHLCNNRCVFCMSGQRTALGLARPVALAPILEELRQAYAAGSRNVTFLGGEPTLQPELPELVRAAAELGFETIVVFSNGVRTAREAYVDELLAAAGPGRLHLRFSFQGGDAQSHDATTQRPGSFARLLRSLDIAAERGIPTSVNTCAVASNYASLARYPALFSGRAVRQVHVDMVRPLDAGERTEAELRAMMPRYSDMAPALLRMVQGFPPSFDVNVGNFPGCVEPRLSPWIHHDGEPTRLISVDGDGALQPAVEKYAWKRVRDRRKPASCASCVLDDRCAGVTETYARFWGVEELAPITPARLAAADPTRRLLAAHLSPVAFALREWTPPTPFTTVSLEREGETLRVTLVGADPLRVRLQAPGGGIASCESFALELVDAPRDRASALVALRALWARVAGLGGRTWRPLGDDTFVAPAPAIASRLARLRAAAPFGALAWLDVVLSEGGARAELRLQSDDGTGAVFWLADRAPKVGYRLTGAQPEASAPLREGLAAIFRALASSPRAAERA